MLNRLLPKGSLRRKFVRRLAGVDVFAPRHLAKNFRSIPGLPDDVDLDQDEPTSTYAGRLAFARHCVVPWLNRARPMNGARVLEIGCGTGSSTIAMAEQGAVVTAIDVDAEGIAQAQAQCAALKLEVEFAVVNATEIAQRFAGRQFDFIIYYATLEHMTHEERLATLRASWGMLAPGSFWCVTGTPNRLWWFDSHTAYLPFYFWLPDDLAFAYSRFSARKNFQEIYPEATPEKMFHFLRRGRGFGFHEFDLAIKPSEQLRVVSSMSLDLRATSWLNRLRWKFTDDHRYEQLLQRAKPGLHPGFFTKNLNLLIQKD